MKKENKIFALVLLCSLMIGVCLVCATWDMQPIPSDEVVLYIPAARALPHLRFLSEITQAPGMQTALFFGKEVFIGHIAFFQHLLNDYYSLRPMLMVCILAFCLSSILIFQISRTYWGNLSGLICFFLFVTSFWPYTYVLFVRHQLLGLFYSLFSIFWLQRAHRSRWGALMYVLAGASLAASFYSSTISPLYIPYFAATFFYYRHAGRTDGWKMLGLIFMGLALVILYLSYPDFGRSIQGYLNYVKISGFYNHFFYHQNILKEWIARPEAAYGGWRWVFQYLFLALPVIFPLYVACVFFLMWRCFNVPGRNRMRRLIAAISLILLSFSSPLLAEFKHVAQYGANYFSTFIGVLVLIGYVLSDHFKDKALDAPNKRFNSLILGVCAVHLIINGYIFYNDVFKPRMAEVYLSRMIEQIKPNIIYVHRDNPLTEKFLSALDPKILQSVRFKYIDNLYQAQDGYILIPPVVGSSIYLAADSQYSDFDEDIYLNELLRKNVLDHYAVCSFPSMAVSKIWRQEEEILSYRDLILGQFSQEYLNKSKVWLLDAHRVFKDMRINVPCPEYQELVKSGDRNIGKKSALYRYKGLFIHVVDPRVINKFIATMYKVGNPSDKLVFYIYKYQTLGLLPWPGGTSREVDPKDLTTDHKGGDVTFSFDRPVDLTPGDYQFEIFRTGSPSDRDYYRVYTDLNDRLKYIHASQ